MSTSAKPYHEAVRVALTRAMCIRNIPCQLVRTPLAPRTRSARAFRRGGEAGPARALTPPRPLFLPGGETEQAGG